MHGRGLLHIGTTAVGAIALQSSLVPRNDLKQSRKAQLHCSWLHMTCTVFPVSIVLLSN